MRKFCFPPSHIQLHVYDRYVRDLNDLLRNCIKYFKHDEEQMIDYYKKRESVLTSQLKCYQQSSGESKAADLSNHFQQQAMMKWVSRRICDE